MPGAAARHAAGGRKRGQPARAETVRLFLGIAVLAATPAGQAEDAVLREIPEGGRVRCATPGRVAGSARCGPPPDERAYGRSMGHVVPVGSAPVVARAVLASLRPVLASLRSGRRR